MRILNQIGRDEAAKFFPVPGTAARVRAKNQRKHTPPELIEGSYWVYPEGARLVLPLRLVSEANSSRHEHPQTKARRVRLQRNTTGLWLSRLGAADWRGLVRRVVITRLAPRRLDDDNLASACKAVRDQIACWRDGKLSITARGNDGPSSGVTWQVEQRVSRVYGVEVLLSV